MTILCLVTLPDSLVMEVELDAKAKGEECVNEVCRYLRLIEQDYFGLQQEGSKGETLWINLRNRLAPQLSGGSAPHRLRLRVKFLVEPHLLLQEETRHQFYLHVREELRAGRLACPDGDRAVALAALVAQAELGDHGGLRGGKAVDDVYDCPGRADPERVREAHRALAGCPRATAEYRALQEASALPGFGVEWHRACDAAGRPRLLAVGRDGVAECDTGSRAELRRIPFSAIHAATQSGKLVVFSVLGDGAGEPEETRFRLVSGHAAGGLYRAVTEAHAFYRCDTVSGAVTAQYSRDFAGHLASLLLSEDVELGKRYVFDIRRTCKEVYDHCRRQLYRAGVAGDCGTPGLASEGGSSGPQPTGGSADRGPRRSPSTPPSATPPSPTRRRQCRDAQQLEERLRELRDAMLCGVCYHGDIDAAFCPCGHMVCCRACATRLQACPLCRCDVDRVQPVFLPLCPRLLRLNSEL